MSNPEQEFLDDERRAIIESIVSESALLGLITAEQASNPDQLNFAELVTQIVSAKKALEEKTKQTSSTSNTRSRESDL